MNTKYSNHLRSLNGQFSNIKLCIEGCAEIDGNDVCVCVWINNRKIVCIGLYVRMAFKKWIYFVKPFKSIATYTARNLYTNCRENGGKTKQNETSNVYGKLNCDFVTQYNCNHTSKLQYFKVVRPTCMYVCSPIMQ